MDSLDGDFAYQKRVKSVLEAICLIRELSSLITSYLSIGRVFDLLNFPMAIEYDLFRNMPQRLKEPNWHLICKEDNILRKVRARPQCAHRVIIREDAPVSSQLYWAQRQVLAMHEGGCLSCKTCPDLEEWIEDRWPCWSSLNDRNFLEDFFHKQTPTLEDSTMQINYKGRHLSFGKSNCQRKEGSQ